MLRDDGRSYASIAETLFLNEEGVRQQLKDYIDSAGKKIKPENGGYNSLLTAAQSQALVKHLEENLYVKVSDICGYVHQTFGIRYSVSGMSSWLRRQDFTFHQPCGVRCKGDGKAQAQFVQDYEKLKKALPDGDHIVYGVHPRGFA